MQNYTTNSFQSNHIGDTSMVYFENNFECLRSMFSGESSPPNAVAGQTWFDINNKVVKIRNSINSKWIGIMHGNANTKIWMYANTAEDGWVIDATAPTDVVLALKGGSQDYNVDGGTVSGTWTQTDCTLTLAQLPIHDHGSDGAHTHSLRRLGYTSGNAERTDNLYRNTYDYPGSTSYNGAHTHDSVGGGESHNHGNTYRPQAAVGTLQYIDL